MVVYCLCCGVNRMRQQVVERGQGQDYDWSNDHIFVKTTQGLTDGRVTLVEDVLKPGFRLPRHHHRVMVEIFYILEGEVVFRFDDEVVIATPGMTITIPALVWHAVQSEGGGRLLTIFSPGGFDRYLEEVAALDEVQLADAVLLTALAERYDTWMR